MKDLIGKKVLVIGGAGFIGSHIVDRLVRINEVMVYDNLSTGVIENLVKSQKDITFIKGDILDKDFIKSVVKDKDYVFHLAASVGNIRSIKDIKYDMETNIIGTLNILEACKESNIQRLIYSSSAAIYGESKYLPIDENHPINPESPYAVSKLAAEKYVINYGKLYNIPVVALRYFNAYGVRQDTSEYANAVSIFMRKFAERKPIIVYGDGEQTRDFVCVYDIVVANLLAATNKEAVGQIFNIATGEPETINNLVRIIQKISEWHGEIKYEPFRLGEMKHSQSDISKAKKILGFNPSIQLEEGIRLTWSAYG